MVNEKSAGKVIDWVLAQPLAIVILLGFVGWLAVRQNAMDARNREAHAAHLAYIAESQKLLVTCYQERQKELQMLLNQAVAK